MPPPPDVPPRRPPGGAALLLGAAATALLAVGCGIRPADPGGVTVAVDSGPSTLDPRLGSDEASRRVNDLVFNSLVRTGDDARPVPDLAERIERPDPLTVVVTLRPGVRFHDGATLTSEDVAATYRSVLDPRTGSFRRADIEEIAALETPGADRIVFRLKHPSAAFVSNLTVPILRAGAGPETARSPIGTGPFRPARYRRDEDLLLQRFEDYFEGRSALTTVRLRIIPSETARLLELLTGGVDLVVNDLPPDLLARVTAETGCRVVSRPGRNTVYLAFNLRQRPLSDVRVRRAIALAIDRGPIVDHLLRGLATLATALLPPGHWAYNPAVPQIACDPRRAALLLDEAGLPDPDGAGPSPRFRVELKIPASDLAARQAAAVQEELAGVGVAVDVRSFEWATFYDDLRAGRFQMVMSNWTDLSDPDVFRLRFHSAAVPPAGFNRGGYRSAEADRLIEAGSETLDEASRRAIYLRLQQILADDLPYVDLWHRHVTAAIGPRLAGFELTTGADFRPLARSRVAATVGSDQTAPEGRLDGGGGYRAGADEPRRVDGEVDDRGGVAAPGRAAVEDQAHRLSEGGLHLVRRGGGRVAGAIGAGGDHRPSQGERQRPGDRMGRDAHAHGAAAAEQPRRQRVGRGDDEGERTGPERLHEPRGRFRDLPGADRHALAAADEERQRHLLGTPFGDEDALHRFGEPWIASEAVEGLGGIGDEEAPAQEPGGMLHHGRIGTLRVDRLDFDRHRFLSRLCVGGATIAQVGVGGAWRRAPRERPV